MQIVAEDHHRQFIEAYKGEKLNHTPKSHWALHLVSEMKMIGPPREFSTLRFEGSFSIIKQKSYSNFLNLPLTVANYYAFRESYNQIYSSSAFHPGVSFSSSKLLECTRILNVEIKFPINTSQYTVNSVTFHNCRYNIGDITRFFDSGIIFHEIRHIILSFPTESSHCEACELENTIFVCKRVHYHYDNKFNLFRVISVDDDVVEIFRASQMSGFQSIPVVNGEIFPPSIGRIPGLPII